MFLSTQFQKIIYGAISCQFYFPLLGHHPKLKLSQKYQGIHHIYYISSKSLYQLFCRSLATHCTSISMVSAKLETTAEYCWELEVSIHNNTPLTAAATWLQLCTLWQLCCRECCTAYNLTSVTNGWELLSSTLEVGPPPHSMSYDGNCNNNNTTATTETFSIWMWGHKGLLPGDWRPSHQMIHHIDPTQSQCHDQAGVLWH